MAQVTFQRGFGLIPDDPDVRDFPIGALLETDAATSEEHSFGFLAHPILDQKGTSSCVLFSAAQAIWIAQGVLGITDRFLLSPLAGYHDARRLKHGREWVLEDVGCAPRYAWEGLRQLGPVAYDDWPFSEAHVNTEIPWEARRRAIDRDWLSYYRIESDGDARIRELRATLDADHPVSLGLAVDQAMLDWDGPWPWTRTGPVIGRHMVTVVGYGPDWFEIVNSWGPGWGINGYGLIHVDAVRSVETSDLTVPVIDLQRFQCVISS